MTTRTAAVVRLLTALSLLVSLSGCTASLNAGDQGGIAFIFFTIMLIATGVILWIIIGREE